MSEFVKYVVGHMLATKPIIDGPPVEVGAAVEVRLICVAEEPFLPNAPIRLRVTDWAGPTEVTA